MQALNDYSNPLSLVRLARLHGTGHVLRESLQASDAWQQANAALARNHGMIASFSRALSEGLSAQQSDDDFDSMLDASIQSIFEASKT